MPGSSLIRLGSVLVVMLVFGYACYGLALAKLKRAGLENSSAKAKAAAQARHCSLIAAFLYMVAMVSVAGLFM
jgi:hypothetical protein